MENERMCTQNIKVRTFRSRLAGAVAMAVFPVLVAACVLPSFAQVSAIKTFSSAGEACDALFQAAQNSDEHELEAIVGAGKEVTSSGDEVEDKLEREQFTRKYQEMHRLVTEADGNTILYIGAENWPFPIPLVSKNGVWRFDSEAGKQEILFRTIGENEATAIQVCDAFASTKKRPETSETSDDAVAGFTQNLLALSVSSGKQGDAVPENGPNLFKGYYFQTTNKARKMALVAYPAQYGSSGIMTFLVTKNGVVYEKDLGPETKTVATEIKGHVLDSSWHRAE
jgi:hypothetical protein